MSQMWMVKAIASVKAGVTIITEEIQNSTATFQVSLQAGIDTITIVIGNIVARFFYGDRYLV